MTLLLGFSAVNTGNNLLYLLVSGLLAFMSVSGLAGWFNIRGLAVSLAPPREVYRNRPVPLAVSMVNNKGIIPSFILEVRLTEGATLFPLVAAGTGESRTLCATFPRRGEVRLNGVMVASRFPINFFVRTIRLPLDFSVIVFPEPLTTPLATAGGTQLQNPVRMSVMAGEGGEIRRIGDYTGTEPMRRIHWRLSARHGDLKVKEFEALSGDPILIELDGLPGHGVEERLCRATFLVNTFFRQGRSVGIRGKGLFIPPAGGPHHRLRVLRELACHDAM